MNDSTHIIIPVLPLRDIVVFPGMVVPLFVGRDKSVRALDHVVTKEESQILLVTQKDGTVDNPGLEDVYKVGTIASVLQLLRLPDGTVKVLVEGQTRARIVETLSETDYYQVTAEMLKEQAGTPNDLKAIFRQTLSHFEEYVKLNKKIQPETLSAISKITDPSALADTVAAHIQIDINAKQRMLEMLDVTERLECVYGLMESEISVLNTEKRIRSRVKRQMEKTQREYYLNEQMKAIQKELGEIEEGKDELGELEERLSKAKMSKEAQEKAKGELKKLRSMSAMSAEASVIRNYLDWLASLPWKRRSPPDA